MYPQQRLPQANQPQARRPNIEIVSRLVFVRSEGNDDERNGAVARLALYRKSLEQDILYPNSTPITPGVETEIWNWWHTLTSKNEASSAGRSAGR